MNRRVRHPILLTVLALLLTALAAPVMAQPVTDLVFCIDGSGSIDDPDWLLQLAGTAAAIANPNIVPQDGTVRITVIQFSNNSPGVSVGPVVIDDTNANGVAAQINGLQQLEDNTNPASCIDLATQTLQGLMPPSQNWVIDISTDGVPNLPSPDPAQAAFTAAQNAMAAGVDQINAIGVGLGSSGQAFLDQLVQPQGSPDPDDDGFVIAIQNFNAYAAAIAQKVADELPDPCTTFDDIETVCTTDGSGDFELTFTFTNHMTDDNGDPIAVTNLWLDNAWLLDAGGNPLPDPVTISPNFFSFAGDPVCSTADPACNDPSRTLSVTVSGASPGQTVRIEVATHDDGENCCYEILDIPVPDCDCLQILDERTRCLWSLPPNFGPHRFWNFTLQNLHPSLTVTRIRLEPISPPFPQIEFNPNSIDGLSLAPQPVAGTTNQWVEVTGPAAVGGQQVSFRIRTYSGTEVCCVKEHEITLPYCRILPEPWPFPVDHLDIKRLERSILVSGFGRDPDSGITFDTERAGGVIVTWREPQAGAGAVIKLDAQGSVGGEVRSLSTLVLRHDGESISVLPDAGLAAVRRVELYAGGEMVGGADDMGVSLRTEGWPTAAAFDAGEGAIAVFFEQPTAVDAGAGPAMVDEAVFYVDDGRSEGITSVTVSAGSIEELELSATAHPFEE